MRKTFIAFLTLVAFSCAEKEVDMTQLVDRNGVMHEINNDTPFSGKVSARFDNQQIKLTGYYDQGLKTKTWNSFKENGQRAKVENYKNGKLNGLSEEYSEENLLLFSREFKEDSLDGKYIEYDSVGGPKLEGTYKNSMKEGLWVEHRWDSTTKRMEYKNNLLDGTFSEINKKGIVTLEGGYEKGIKNGVFISTHDDGRKYREENFNSGELIAIKEWDNFEKVSLERTFPGVSKWYRKGKQIAEAYFSNPDSFDQSSLKMWYNNAPVDVYSIVNGSMWKGEYFNSNQGRYKEYYQYVFNSDGSYHKGYYFLLTPVDNGYSARMQPQGRGRWNIGSNLPSLYISIYKGRNQYPDNTLSISKVSKNEMVIDGKKFTRVSN